MQKRPSSASMYLRHEVINNGRFTPTSENCGSIDDHGLVKRTELMVARVNERDDQRDPHLLVKLVVEIPVGSVAEARRLAEAEWAPVNLAPPEPTTAHIPGKMHATYKDGQIERVWFSPSAAHPGYQDASFFVESGPDAEEGDDRPFWHAMEVYLAVNNPEWEG